MVHLCGEKQVAGGEALAGRQQHLAFAKIPACGTDEILAAEVLDLHGAFVRPGVLLNDDEVRAAWNRCASEDAHGLASADGARKGVPCSGFADKLEGGRQCAKVRLANRIAIHCRGGEGGLGQLCSEFGGENPPTAFGHRHHLLGQGREIGGDTGESIGNGQHCDGLQHHRCREKGRVA